jgi:hypothetical protein
VTSNFRETLRILKDARSLVEMQSLSMSREYGVMELSHAIGHQVDKWLADRGSEKAEK